MNFKLFWSYSSNYLGKSFPSVRSHNSVSYKSAIDGMFIWRVDRLKISFNFDIRAECWASNADIFFAISWSRLVFRTPAFGHASFRISSRGQTGTGWKP